MIFIFWVILSIISFFFSIKLLRKMQIKQTIYESGPTEHQKKSGTPTMGGVLIFFIFFTGVMILGSWNIPTIWIVFSAFLFFVIGVIDDMKSLRNKTNKGLSAKSKFILQLIVSLSLIFLLHRFIKPVSLLEVPLYVFLFTGASNATNLTDGVDGLLSGTMIISLLGVLFILFQTWRYEEAFVTVILIISLGIFLLFNWNPAKIFMGDSGSLMLGGYLAAICIVIGKWWMLTGFGAIYAIETLSVIIQVISYKFRKKRVFLMTPLHHHFELMGFSEILVVLIFIFIQIVFTAIQIL